MGKKGGKRLVGLRMRGRHVWDVTKWAGLQPRAWLFVRGNEYKRDCLHYC